MRLVVTSQAGAGAVAYGLADTTQLWPLGSRAFAVAGDYSVVTNVLSPSGEFVYGQSAAAMAVGTPVNFLANTGIATAMAVTANTGDSIAVAASRFTAAGQFGWFQVSGMAPVVTNATFAASAAVFKQAAGVLSTTVLAGGQILGMRSIVATAATFTKTNSRTKTGSLVVRLTNTDGIFAGLAISGTGIPGGATVADVDDGGRTVTLSAAATASGSITATLTYTGFGGVFMNHPHAQGQIT